MTDDVSEYELKSVKAVRGTESLIRKKWEKRGWELADESTVALRTTMTFRRRKPRWGWLKHAALPAAVVALAVVIGVGAVLDNDERSLAPPEAPVVPEGTSSDPITVENDNAFAKLLAGPAGGKSVRAFAKNYEGKTVEFVGFVERHYEVGYQAGDGINAIIRAGTPSAPTGPRLSIGAGTTTNIGGYVDENAERISWLEVDTRVRVKGEVGEYDRYYASNWVSSGKVGPLVLHLQEWRIAVM